MNWAGSSTRNWLKAERMKSGIIRIATLVIAGLAISCAQQSEQENEVSPFEDYLWMSGKWNLTDDPSVYEVWKVHDDMLSGISYKVFAGDTSVMERLEITEAEGVFQLEVFLSDTTPSVIFSMPEKEVNRLSFSNPDHDFPKDIIYTKLGMNSLRAEVRGDGRKQRFLFVRRP